MRLSSHRSTLPPRLRNGPKSALALPVPRPALLPPVPRFASARALSPWVEPNSWDWSEVDDAWLASALETLDAATAGDRDTWEECEIDDRDTDADDLQP